MHKIDLKSLKAANFLDMFIQIMLKAVKLGYMLQN